MCSAKEGGTVAGGTGRPTQQGRRTEKGVALSHGTMKARTCSAYSLLEQRSATVGGHCVCGHTTKGWQRCG